MAQVRIPQPSTCIVLFVMVSFRHIAVNFLSTVFSCIQISFFLKQNRATVVLQVQVENLSQDVSFTSCDEESLCD